jgi:hypothetical protein
LQTNRFKHLVDFLLNRVAGYGDDSKLKWAVKKRQRHPRIGRIGIHNRKGREISNGLCPLPKVWGCIPVCKVESTAARLAGGLDSLPYKAGKDKNTPVPQSLRMKPDADLKRPMNT